MKRKILEQFTDRRPLPKIRVAGEKLGNYKRRQYDSAVGDRILDFSDDAATEDIDPD